jgi:hypothetical protein
VIYFTFDVPKFMVCSQAASGNRDVDLRQTSTFSKPKIAARSKRLLLRSCRIGQMPLLLVPSRSSSIVACRS